MQGVRDMWVRCRQGLPGQGPPGRGGLPDLHQFRCSADLPTRIDGIPCLMIMAEKDVVLSPAMADGMEDVISDLEKVLIKDSGHWTQQEKPEEVNRLILDWMGRRFPK